MSRWGCETPALGGMLVKRSLTVSRLVRLVAALLVGAAIVAAIRPQDQPVATAAGGQPVISQVYGAGGNSGATYTNDFVEIFNPGSGTATLTGLSVQYASATGTGTFAANGVIALSGSLAPGQYYLVQLASGANGIALPTADASGTINMAAGAGKVVLVNSTTGLACNGSSTPCTSTQLAQIVDLVGYGSANFFEGALAAPAISIVLSDQRASGGCIDTDQNGADFAAAAPNPRNTASAFNVCGVPTATPATATPTATATATLTPTVTNTPVITTRIHDIQGVAHLSLLANQAVVH